jgi:hypothetical protein
MLEMRGGYLYQHRPDVIPQGRLTDEEVCLWAAFRSRRDKEEGGR